MFERWSRYKTGAIVVSICLLAVGILMAVYPEISALTVCVALGILCIAAGAYCLMRYFKLGIAGMLFRFDLMMGLCCVIVGMLFLLHPNGAAALMPIALGIYLLIGGVTDIQFATEMRRLGAEGTTLALILAIARTVFAVFLLVNPFTGAKAVMIFAGISLMASGIQGLYTVCCVTRAIKNGIGTEVIEGKWTPIE